MKCGKPKSQRITLTFRSLTHRRADVSGRDARHDGLRSLPAFLALLRDTWAISNSEAGFIGGAYFAGYMTPSPSSRP